MNEPDLIAALIALSNDLGGDSEGTIMQGVAELHRLDTELNCLNHNIVGMRSSNTNLVAERDAAKAEIARLTAERDEWQRQHDIKDHRCFALAQRAEKAEAEIARLTAERIELDRLWTIKHNTAEKAEALLKYLRENCTLNDFSKMWEERDTAITRAEKAETEIARLNNQLISMAAVLEGWETTALKPDTGEKP